MYYYYDYVFAHLLIKCKISPLEDLVLQEKVISIKKKIKKSLQGQGKYTEITFQKCALKRCD